MFLGAIEVDQENVFTSDSALNQEFTDNDIIIIENEYVLASLLTNEVIFRKPCFRYSNWFLVKDLSKKHIVVGLVFAPKTTDQEIQYFLKKRLEYFYKLYKREVKSMNIEVKDKRIIFDTVLQPVL